jgi:ribonucleoside-diphosphate reductase alpha chain
LDLGVEENTPPTEPLPETAESHPVEGNGNGNGHGKSNGSTNGGTNGGMSVQALGTVVLTNRGTQNSSALAKLKGYEGDPCGECGQLTLVRNGTCLKCLSCGATSGCS